MKIVVSFLKEGVHDFAQCTCLVQHLSLKNGKTRVEYKGKGQTHKDAAAVRTQARSKSSTQGIPRFRVGCVPSFTWGSKETTTIFRVGSVLPMIVVSILPM